MKLIKKNLLDVDCNHLIKKDNNLFVKFNK